MTEILNNDFIDKDSKKKKQIFVAQEHQADQIEKSKNLLKKQQQDKEEENEILPLENEWSFWEDHYTNNNNSIASIEEYLNALKQLYSFSTIQDFWSSFNKIPNISKLPNNSCFHLFKKGTRPIWEENEEGGEFVLKVKKFQTDEIWNELVLSVIGEQFSSYLPDNDDICGISIRKKQGADFNMIHIWNKNTKGREDIPRAIKHLFPLLLDECIQTFYREHGAKPQPSSQLPQINRMQQLKNMNRSASVLKSSSNAFVPRKTVRFNLPKSKSESVIASPTSTRKQSPSQQQGDNKTKKQLLSTEEASPGNVGELKPILSKKMAKVPVGLDQIKDLKPAEKIQVDSFNQENQGVKDDYVEKMNQEFENVVERELNREIQKEIQKRRQEELDEEIEQQEGLVDDDDNGELGHEYSPVSNDEIVPNLLYNNFKDEVVPEDQEEEEEDIVHHGYSKETELPELKKQKINFEFDPVDENQPDGFLDELVKEEEEFEKEKQEQEQLNELKQRDEKELEEFLKPKEQKEKKLSKRQQKKLKKQKSKENLKQQQQQLQQEKQEQSQEKLTEEIEKEIGTLDNLLHEQESSINDLNKFVQKEQKEQEQESKLKETKDLLSNDLVQDENEINEKLKQEKMEKQIDSELDEIVDGISEDEIDEELNEEIDSWEEELGIDDPNHVFREDFKNEYRNELKKDLKDDIKQVVKEEINEIVQNSLNQQKQQELQQEEIKKQKKLKQQQKQQNNNNYNNDNNNKGIFKYDTLSDKPTIEES